MTEFKMRLSPEVMERVGQQATVTLVATPPPLFRRTLMIVVSRGPESGLLEVPKYVKLNAQGSVTFSIRCTHMGNGAPAQLLVTQMKQNGGYAGSQYCITPKIQFKPIPMHGVVIPTKPVVATPSRPPLTGPTVILKGGH